MFEAIGLDRLYKCIVDNILFSRKLLEFLLIIQDSYCVFRSIFLLRCGVSKSIYSDEVQS